MEPEVSADDDFTALGDTVNVAARLGGVARAGELIVSPAAWDRQPRDATPTDRRSVTVQGRAEPLDVVVLQVGSREAVAA